MGNLLTATIFIIVMNLFMWWASIAQLTINPDSSICYNLEGSVIENTIYYNENGSVLNNDVLSQMPDAQTTQVSGTTTTFFTDIFNNIVSYFKETTGLKYVYAVIAAPYNILKCTNLPSTFIVGIGTFWYLISFLIFISYLWGRE